MPPYRVTGAIHLVNQSRKATGNQLSTRKLNFPLEKYHYRKKLVPLLVPTPLPPHTHAPMHPSRVIATNKIFESF